MADDYELLEDLVFEEPAEHAKRGLDKIQGMTRGICQVCGKDLPKKSAFYCDDHKPERARRPKKAPTKVEVAASTVKAAKVKKTVTPDDMWAAFGTIITAVANYLLLNQYRQVPEQILEPYVDKLVVSEDEAEAIVKPVLRLALSYEPVAKAAGPVVANADVAVAITAVISIAQRHAEVRKELIAHAESLSNPLGSTNGVGNTIPFVPTA